MSQRLGPVGRRDLIKTLRRLGWSGPWHGCNHQMMTRASGKPQVSPYFLESFPSGLPSGLFGMLDGATCTRQSPAECGPTPKPRPICLAQDPLAGPCPEVLAGWCHRAHGGR